MTDPEFEQEAETGMPFVQGAQRCTGLARMTEDYDGTVVTETMVLPNFVFFWTMIAGVRVGQSVMCSPPFGASFREALQETIDHVNGCDCRVHAGRSMAYYDPETDLD